MHANVRTPVVDTSRHGDRRVSREEHRRNASREGGEGGITGTPVDAPHICLVMLLMMWKTKTITHDGLLCS